MVKLGHTHASPVTLFDALHGLLEHLNGADLLLLPKEGKFDDVTNFHLTCEASTRHYSPLAFDLETVIDGKHEIPFGPGLAVWNLHLVQDHVYKVKHTFS